MQEARRLSDRARYNGRRSAELGTICSPRAREASTASTCNTAGYDRPQADGSPRGTLGPQSPAPTGSDPVAIETGVPKAENGAAVSCRRVPNRSSVGV